MQAVQAPQHTSSSFCTLTMCNGPVECAFVPLAAAVAVADSPCACHRYQIPAKKDKPSGAARFVTKLREYDSQEPLILFSGDCLNPSPSTALRCTG